MMKDAMEPTKPHRPNGVALFSWITGALFLAYGILNFYMNAPIDLRLRPFHASLHVLLGLAGLFLPRYRRTYLVAVTAIGLTCSIIGFAGVNNVPGLLTLNTPLNYGYAVIGMASLLVVVSQPSRTTPTTPE